MVKNNLHLNRREFMTISTLGILSGMTCSKNPPSYKQPNLVFVFADQFRRQAMGFMDEDPVLTPNFDQFAAESLCFTNAISSAPVCSPFRAMLMTGRYPLSNGISGNCKNGIDTELNENETCIGDVLKQEGYRTGYIGKWHLECPSLNKIKEPPDKAEGADAWTPPGPRRHGFDFWYAYNTHADYFHPHYWNDRPEAISVDEWIVKHETDVAIEFLKKYDGRQPFALFLSWYPPHPPHIAPDRYVNLYSGKRLDVRPNASETEQRIQYYAQVTGCDDEFGRLLNVIDDAKLKDNTIVIFTSDHGEMMGSHRRMNKDVWYEEAVGIPFLIRWPENIKPRNTDMLFAVYDFMPTLLGLMGLPVPETVQGTDYSRTLLGLSNEQPTSAVIAHYALPVKGHFLAEGIQPNKSVSFALSVENAGIDPSQWGFRGIRTKRYTYVVDRTPAGIEGFSFNDELSTPYQGSDKIRITRLLYDNQEDPYQLKPVIALKADENTIMKELDGELRTWLKRMNDPFPLDD